MKFFYLRDEFNNPVGCVASELSDKNGELDGKGDHVMFAISTHNPSDPFNKKIAKAVAYGRLLKGEMWLTPLVSKVKWHIMKIIATDSGVPVKSRRAATIWLNTHQNGGVSHD